MERLARTQRNQSELNGVNGKQHLPVGLLNKHNENDEEQSSVAENQDVVGGIRASRWQNVCCVAKSVLELRITESVLVSFQVVKNEVRDNHDNQQLNYGLEVLHRYDGWAPLVSFFGIPHVKMANRQVTLKEHAQSAVPKHLSIYRFPIMLYFLFEQLPNSKDSEPDKANYESQDL